MVRTDILARMPESDLRKLNTAIVEEIRRRIAEQKRESINAFKVGDIASFVHNGKIEYIQVSKINRTTVEGYKYDPLSKAYFGGKWRVSATALSKCASD